MSCSGIDITFREDENKYLIVDIAANNERDVLCVENIDCPGMIVDIEISCSSLR